MAKSLRAALAALALLVGVPSISAAAELVMVDLLACTYCSKFRREVAPIYAGTEAGHVAPLRRVSPLKRWPKDLAAVKPAPYTPVFILVEHGREIGRFAGYTDPETFWAKLKPLLARL